METPDLKYWVAFSRIPSIGRARGELLERRFGSLENAWSASSSDLREAGLDQRSVSAVAAVRPRIDPDGEMERLAGAGVRALIWSDPDYPELLTEVHDRPPVLYLKGSLVPEDRRSVAVVGTRQATAYGREAAHRLSADLARNGVTIASGLARGIDAIAHRATLEVGGRTIAVFGCGLDVIYPPEHAALAAQIAENGALVSEYPLGVRPLASHFPRRNRIMSGLTLGTLVVEAGETSGAMITVRHALEQNREVFCVPGSIFSPSSRGTNQLIQEGAKLVLNYRHVLEELNLSDLEEQLPIPALFAPADDTEAVFLRHISYEAVHTDELGRRTGLPMPTVSSTLTLMEIKGLVKQVGPMSYMRTREAPAVYG